MLRVDEWTWEWWVRSAKIFSKNDGSRMNTFFSFVTMSAILFLVYTQITYIKADWCSAEIDRTRDHLYSIIEHFDIPVDVEWSSLPKSKNSALSVVIHL